METSRRIGVKRMFGRIQGTYNSLRRKTEPPADPPQTILFSSSGSFPANRAHPAESAFVFQPGRSTCSPSSKRWFSSPFSAQERIQVPRTCTVLF